MTKVNSKLTKLQKAEHFEMLANLSDLNGKVFCFPEYRATIAIMPEFEGSRMMLVSVSIAEPREKKFRCKVGEYHAMRRMFDLNQYIILPTVFDLEETDPDYPYSEDEIHDYQREWANNFAASLRSQYE